MKQKGVQSRRKSVFNLLQLPVELLDLCFGLPSDLAPRDYIALAGTHPKFREKLDDDFFNASSVLFLLVMLM